MAELATIARPYAEALFQVVQNGDLETWSLRLDEMAQVAVHPDVSLMAHNPRFTTTQVGAAFLSLLKTPAVPESGNLIAALVRLHRLSLLPEIARQFHILKNVRGGAVDAHIVSAFPMDDGQLKQVMPKLEKRFGRTLIPTVSVDQSLIGGIQVTVGDEVFDSSVKASLQRLSAAMVA